MDRDHQISAPRIGIAPLGIGGDVGSLVAGDGNFERGEHRGKKACYL
jgi:hypothetical protein